MSAGEQVLADAAVAAAIVAIDPARFGGVVLRARAGATRDRWLALLAASLDGPLVRMPLHTTADRLLGGLDLAATLGAGRPVVERGLLARADGGVLVASMAERLSPKTVAHLCAALDTHRARIERDGLTDEASARFAVVALDEGIDDEGTALALADRLAVHVDLGAARSTAGLVFDAADFDIEGARTRFQHIEVDDDAVEVLCTAALALGIDSARAPLLALAVARGSAALDGRTHLAAEDLERAARLVLAPRATQLPTAEPEDSAPEPEPDEAEDETTVPQDGPMEDVVLQAATAAIPEGLLEALTAGRLPRGAAGVAGVRREDARRGRPKGVRAGLPEGGARLDLVATLRAAAPWQTVRRRDRDRQRIEVRRDDLRVKRFEEHTETTTIFVVDASGSSALQRMAEAKGAVEHLLAECYVRRDYVTLTSFRGTSATQTLPPTKSLVRAKRLLAGLPGGGTTPLAAGIDAALASAEEARRRGRTPVVVLITDGRGNIARDGTPGRPAARADALSSARLLRASRARVLFVDTAVRSQPQAVELAQAMGAMYLPLPRTDAAGIAATARSLAEAAR
ncbi:MAG: magnesium chelatase subunit D [Deltaproteobacteria bacterium]